MQARLEATVFLVAWFGLLLAYEQQALYRHDEGGTVSGLVQFCDERFPVVSLIVAALLVGLWLHLFRRGWTIP